MLELDRLPCLVLLRHLDGLERSNGDDRGDDGGSRGKVGGSSTLVQPGELR